MRLALGRPAEGDRADLAGIERRCDRADRPAFAGGITPLDHDRHAPARVTQPTRERVQFELHWFKQPLVFFLLQVAHVVSPIWE